MYKCIVLVLAIFLLNCKNTSNEKEIEEKVVSPELPKQPNILWLVTEDMGPYIPPFGDNTIATPNISRLAQEGVIYPNLYSTSGVCAPSRAAIATGMYPSSIGANHMRVNSYTHVTGLPAYEAVPPPETKMISEWLRLQGYYCTNNSKEDYQFKAPKSAWDESSSYAHWRNRKKDQPFFAIFNFNETHESGLFEPYGHRYDQERLYVAGDRSFKKRGNGKKRMDEQETTIHLPKDTKFNIPPYLPDTDVVKRDMWKTYNNIAEMDKQVGAILKQLEDDNLLENTIIFFYGDHGGPLPREKRLIYDSGLNTPMIIRFPNKLQSGTKDNQLISFVDFAPTLLSLVGVSPKKYMQGQAFLGAYKADKARQHIHAAADRFDGFTDAIRAVRDKQFKYIRNYRTNQGYYLPVSYREKIPTMQELLRLHAEGKLNDNQKQWFRTRKPKEELFDCVSDPFELNNVANNPKFKNKIIELRKEMDYWLKNIGDKPNLPESDLIKTLWQGSLEQPVTSNPIITISNNTLHISTETKGASIAYKIMGNDERPLDTWSIYTKPLPLLSSKKKSQIMVQAHRIGFKPSEIINFSLDI